MGWGQGGGLHAKRVYGFTFGMAIAIFLLLMVLVGAYGHCYCTELERTDQNWKRFTQSVWPSLPFRQTLVSLTDFRV